MALVLVASALAIIFPLIWGIILTARLFRYIAARIRATVGRIREDGIRRHPPRRGKYAVKPESEPVPEPLPEPVAAGTEIQ